MGWLQALSRMPGNFNILCPGNPSVLKNRLNLFQDFFHQTTLHLYILYDLCKSVDLQICKWGSYCTPEVLTWQVKNKKTLKSYQNQTNPTPISERIGLPIFPLVFFQGKTTRVKRRFEGGNLAARKVTLNTSASQVTKVGAPNLALNKKNKEATDIFYSPEDLWLPWEPKTFIFRGYNPYIGGLKPSFFHGFGVQGWNHFFCLEVWFGR